MATIRVTTTPDVILRHAFELATDRKRGEDVWDAQARTLGELGYEIVGKPDDDEPRVSMAGPDWRVEPIADGSILYVTEEYYGEIETVIPAEHARAIAKLIGGAA